MNQLSQPISVDLRDYANLLGGTLSTEGFDVLSHIPEFFTNKLSVVASYFTTQNDAISNIDIKKYNVYFKDLDKSRRKITLAKGGIEYVMVKRRLVPAIIGVNVDVLQLTTTLRESNSEIMTNLIPLLKETSVVVAKLVTDKEFRLSSRPVIINKKYAKMVTSITKNLDSVTDHKSISDTSKVSDLAPTIMHIVEACNIAVTYGNSTTVDFYKEIQKEVDIISSYTDSLYDALVSDGKSIKKQRIQEVSEYLNAAANAVTMSINTMYLSSQSAIQLVSLVDAVTHKGK